MKKSIVAATFGSVALVATAGAFASGGSGATASTGWQGKAIARVIAAEHAGKISQAKGDAKIARIQAGHRPGRHLRRLVLGEAASSLGMSRSAVRAELRTGKSLAQVLSEHGVSVTGFEQAVLAKAIAQLDAGQNLDPTRKQAILSKLPARLDKLVNHVFSTSTSG